MKVDGIIRDQCTKMACVRIRQIHAAIGNGDLKKAKRNKILANKEFKRPNNEL